MLETMGPPPARAQLPPRRRPRRLACSFPASRGRRPRRSSSPRSGWRLPPTRLPLAAAEPRAPVKKAPVAKAPVPKKAKASCRTGSDGGVGAGFVAVLSSQKSRMDALKIFANMQEKYGDVLCEQDARRAGSQPRREGCPVSARGRSAGLARCGFRLVHAAQGRRLRRLLGHGVLRRSFSWSASRACTGCPQFDVEQRRCRCDRHVQCRGPELQLPQPRGSQGRKSDLGMLSAFITGLAGPSLPRARQLCCARRARAASSCLRAMPSTPTSCAA